MYDRPVIILRSVGVSAMCSANSEGIFCLTRVAAAELHLPNLNPRGCTIPRVEWTQVHIDPIQLARGTEQRLSSGTHASGLSRGGPLTGRLRAHLPQAPE